MPLYINNTPITSGVKHYFNGVQIKDVYYRHGTNSSFTHVYQYDNVAPTINISGITSGYSPTRTYNLSGTLIDYASGVASAYYTHGNSTQHPITVTPSSETGKYTFSVDITLTDGANNITVYATDEAGNVGSRPLSIVYDNAAHTATLTTALITPTQRVANPYYEHGIDHWSNTNGSDNYKQVINLGSTSTGEGLRLGFNVGYWGTINLTALPDYQYIKRVVISKYAQGTETFNVTSGQTTIAFNDTSYNNWDSNSYFPTSPRTWSRTGTAGISALTYYYT